MHGKKRGFVIRKTPWLLVLALGWLTAHSSNVQAEINFRVRLLDDPLYFDWSLAYGKEAPLLVNMMEGLVEYDRQMKIAPLLAESWTVSADGKSYTFKLRPNVKWSDGRLLTAEDFVYSWLRLLAPATGATYASILFDIEGAEDYHAGKLKDPSLVGIAAPTPDKLVVRLRAPKPLFLQLLAFWATFPVRRDLIEKYGASWAHPGKVAVLGPFVPVSYQPHSQVILKRNENYHRVKPKIDSVTFKIINEENNALKAFAAGEIDYALFYGKTSDVESARLLSSLHSASVFKVCSLYFNVSLFPFSIKKIRQAFATGINRSAVTLAATGDPKPASSFVPPDLFPPGKDSIPGYDPVKAKKLLQESIGEIGKLPKIEFTTYTSDENTRLASKLTDSLAQDLGIKISVSAVAMPEYHNRIALKIAPIFYGCWGADYADPDTFFTVYKSDDGNNRTLWKNAHYDALVKEAALSNDSNTRSKLYVEALQLMLQDEAVIIPLYFPRVQYFLNPKFKGLVLNPLSYVFFKDVTTDAR